MNSNVLATASDLAITEPTYIHQILNANSVIEFLNKILVQAQEDDYFSLNPTIPESEQNLFE